MAEHAEYTTEQYDQEYALFSRRPHWELRNVKRALTSFRWSNTSVQEARLAAVEAIMSEKGWL